MSDFLAGRILVNNGDGVFNNGSVALPKREFSKEAQAVVDAGRELWRYYHKHGDTGEFSVFNVNAGLYEIREFFKGRNGAGRLKAKSEDAEFNKLDGNLREALKVLGNKIVPKVFEYGFLLE